MRLAFMIGAVLGAQVGATEIDSFTLRGSQMQDSVLGLNSLMQGYFDQALIRANQAKSCEPKIIENALYDVSGGQTWAKIELAIGDSKWIDHRRVLRGDSIYQEISFFDAYALYIAQLGYLMKIQDYYVGSDKIGHFIGIGYTYYQYPSLSEAMDFGELTERTYFGLNTTAIYSYADLIANYEGYLFWNRVAKSENPYFICRNNSWKQQAEFTWLDYMSPAWDEGINCSYYKTKEIEDSVQKRIHDLGFSCPIDKKYCPAMKEHYGDIAARLITAECF